MICARIVHLELDSLFDHFAEMIERHVARGLGIVEAPVRVFFYDDRTGRPAFLFAQAGSSVIKIGDIPLVIPLAISLGGNFSTLCAALSRTSYRIAAFFDLPNGAL